MAAQSTETERQHSLDAYHIVDSLPDAAYEDIARLAAMLCGAPIALVSLIDRDRQWFKARVGFEPGETPREHAVCDHAIREPGRLFEVPDLSLDPRFAGNPHVTEDGARFYAGMPLVTPGGAAVGTVCVLDHSPRTLDDAQREALSSLARLTMNLMEYRRREREREAVDAIAPVAQAAATVEADMAVCLVELQGQARLVQWHGERAVERLLNELDAAIGAGLGVGDSIDRVTGSAEFVIALHGAGIDGALDRIHRLVADFAARHDLDLPTAHARSTSPDESPTSLYLRAEAALSDAKDRQAEPRAMN